MTTASQQDTLEIREDQWIPFMAEFTRENRGAHARLSIVGADTDVGCQVETEGRSFDGVAADVRGRERTVWISFGSTAADHMTHGVHNAVAFRVLRPTESRGFVLEVEASDGEKTILELTLPADYALAPGESR
jgi:Family of unknown function (DUF5335)